MNILCVVIGLNIYVIFLFKRELLLQIKPFSVLLAFNILLFITAHLLEYHHIGNPNFIAALKIPAPQQLLFFGMLNIYRKIYHKDPQDTFWSMDWKLMKDGIFNFIFWSSSVIPTLLALDNVI
jgi:hypothetical protein